MARTKKVIFNYKNVDAEQARVAEEAYMNYSCANLAKTFHGTKSEVESIISAIVPVSFTVKGKDKKSHTVTASLLTLSYNRFAHGGVYKIRVTHDCGKEQSATTMYDLIYAGRDKHMTYEIIDNVVDSLARKASGCVYRIIEG